MLNRILRAPTSFFDTTPVGNYSSFALTFNLMSLGRVLNRFGKDQYVLDENLPQVNHFVHVPYFVLINLI